MLLLLLMLLFYDAKAFYSTQLKERIAYRSY